MMTFKEMLNAIVENPSVDEEVRERATHELESLAKQSESRKSANAKKKADEYAPLIEKISAVLDTEKEKLTSVIAAEVGLSTSMTSAICRKMVDNGLAVAHDVKVKGKGMQKAYTLAG